jgi:hypothetical protein
MKLHLNRSTKVLGHVLGMALTLGAAALFSSAPAAHAASGAKLIAGGPIVRVTILPKDAAYTREIYLKQPGTSWLYLGRSDETGRVRTILVYPGRELQFAIRVLNTGHVFYMGPRERNADGLVHAEIYPVQGGHFVGWEDLYGQTDEDYNDVTFRVQGAVRYGP